MKDFPHTYKVHARAETQGDVNLSADAVPSILSQPPVEFGGPGDRWSPESLLMAAVADCFALSFRAIANASKFSFNHLSVEVNGDLNQVDKKMLFTEIRIAAELGVSSDADKTRAERLLQMAEQACLVTNSLSAECHLSTSIYVE